MVRLRDAVADGLLRVADWATRTAHRLRPVPSGAPEPFGARHPGAVHDGWPHSGWSHSAATAPGSGEFPAAPFGPAPFGRAPFAAEPSAAEPFAAEPVGVGTAAMALGPEPSASSMVGPAGRPGTVVRVAPPTSIGTADAPAGPTAAPRPALIGTAAAPAGPVVAAPMVGPAGRPGTVVRVAPPVSDAPAGPTGGARPGAADAPPAHWLNTVGADSAAMPARLRPPPPGTLPRFGPPAPGHPAVTLYQPPAPPRADLSAPRPADIGGPTTVAGSGRTSAAAPAEAADSVAPQPARTVAPANPAHFHAATTVPPARRPWNRRPSLAAPPRPRTASWPAPPTAAPGAATPRTATPRTATPRTTATPDTAPPATPARLPDAGPEAWPELLTDAGLPASSTEDDDRDARLSAEQEGRPWNA